MERHYAERFLIEDLYGVHPLRDWGTLLKKRRKEFRSLGIEEERKDSMAPNQLYRSHISLQRQKQVQNMHGSAPAPLQVCYDVNLVFP